MALTIKAIRDKDYDKVAQWIGIDDFDTVKLKKNYFLTTRIYYGNNKTILTSNQDALLRGSMFPHRDCRVMRSDVFEKPGITMYIILGQRLKREGIIFNKKLGEFKCAKDKKESLLF